MHKTTPLIMLMLVLALVCGACSNSSGPDSSPTPLNEPGESPSAAASVQEETSSPKASDAQPTADAEVSILGELAGDQYINEAFGFTAIIPEGWTFASKEELQQVSGQAGDLVESATDLDPDSSVMLMMCSQLPLGSTGAFNPNINITYSNQTEVLLALTDATVFNQLLDQLQSSYTELYAQIFPGASVSASGEQSLTINGKEYVLARVDTTFDDGAMYQEQYFTKAGDGMITVTATYYDSSEKAVMDAFIQSVVFE